jgi:two-component sensor histidine kinase
MLDLLAAVGSQIAQFIVRHRAESALQKIGRRLQAVVDAAPVLLFAIDAAGILTLAQGRGLEMAGLPADGGVGHSAFDVFPGHHPAIERALAGDAFADTFELNERVFETVWTPVWGPHGTPNGTIAVSVDITERARAERAMEQFYRASLHEKEVLLKEIHHRVKNNLQLVNSLLALQSAQLESLHPDITSAFTELQLRIQTMALIHETLYRAGDVTEVQLAPHVETICAHIVRSYETDPDQIALDVRIDDVSMGLDIALPCGLIINELVANAMKHAFPGGRRGAVSVMLATSPGRFDLEVRDDGIGLPATVDPLTTDTLGLQLVRDMADQLHAKLEIDRRDGTAFQLRVPRPGVEAR